jgi:signal-transduction protein with cAMP-binding, CBS, and nucleotidyltransferase domain
MTRASSARERKDESMIVERMLAEARKKLVTIGDRDPLIVAARLLASKEANLVIVCNPEGALAGVIAKTDVVRQIGDCQGHGCTTAASAVMTRDIACCRPRDFLKDVWATMKERGLKHVPVIDHASRPIELLTARDVLDGLLDEVEYEEELLRDYVMSIGYH